jgi:hypothetical protein
LGLGLFNGHHVTNCNTAIKIAGASSGKRLAFALCVTMPAINARGCVP